MTTWCDTDSCASNTKCYCKTKKYATARRRGYTSDNLALDYELFTIGSGSGNGVTTGVNHHENGKHVKAHEALSVKKSVEMAALFADVKLSQTTDIKNLKPFKPTKSNKSTTKSVKSTSKKDTVKSNRSEQTNGRNVDLKKTINKDIEQYAAVPRPVSATLEDSLGYLP